MLEEETFSQKIPILNKILVHISTLQIIISTLSNFLKQQLFLLTLLFGSKKEFQRISSYAISSSQEKHWISHLLKLLLHVCPVSVPLCKGRGQLQIQLSNQDIQILEGGMNLHSLLIEKSLTFLSPTHHIIPSIKLFSSIVNTYMTYALRDFWKRAPAY